MDEIDAYKAIALAREQINEVELLSLHKALNTMLSLIEGAHARITDLTDAEDNEE
jgi:hypothetical protein